MSDKEKENKDTRGFETSGGLSVQDGATIRPVAKHLGRKLETFYPLGILKVWLNNLWRRKLTLPLLVLVMSLSEANATYKVIAEDMLTGCTSYSHVVDSQQPVAGSMYNSSVWIAIGGYTRSFKEIQNGGTVMP